MVIPLHAQENSDLNRTSCVPVRTVNEDSLAFHSGEVMSFVLHYKWGAINTDVGTATVRLDSLTFNGEDAFCCSVYGKTTKIFDLFFKVREDFKSWFTRNGLRPLKFTRDTHEGGYEARNTYLYDYNEMMQIFEVHLSYLKHFLSLKELLIILPLYFQFLQSLVTLLN